MSTIDEKRKLRFQFLNLVYEKTEGSKYQTVNIFEIGKELGWDENATDLIVQYLEGESLVKHEMGGYIIITHKGVKEIEEALTNPKTSTTYFPPIINIMSGDFRGAILNVDTELNNSSQNIGDTFNTNENISNELHQLLEEFKQALLKVPTEKANESEAATWAAETLIKERTSGNKNPAKIEITKEGLRKAANNIASVTPTVLLIAEKIISALERMK